VGIKENLKARLAAEQVAELADEEAKVHGRRFWEQLMLIVSAHVPPPRKPRKVPAEPMTDKEARLFGMQPMPYGEYVAKPVDDVPLPRLQWYADQTFTDDLRRYLESSRIRNEGGDESS
jgi:uncharacterized protein (DUF3820 family)